MVYNLIRAAAVALFTLWSGLAFDQTTPGRPSAGPFLVDNAPYNAHGDGVLDDTPAFTAALADCVTAGGGTVAIGAKKYLIDTASITIPRQCTLNGGLSQFGASPPYFLYSQLKYLLILNPSVTINMGSGPGNGARGAGLSGVAIISKNYNTAAADTLRDNIGIMQSMQGGGTAITSNSPDTTITNVVMWGFNTCFTSSRGRQTIDGVLGDCINGILLDGSHDSSWVVNTEIAFYGTNNLNLEETSTISTAANNGSGIYRITVPSTTVAINTDLVSIINSNVQNLNKRWTLSNRTCAATCTFDLVGATSIVATVVNGTTTYGTTVVPVTSAANIAAGQNVSGTGIQATTTVKAVWPDKNLVWLTLPANANGTVSLTFSDPTFTVGSMVLSPGFRPGGKAYSCTNSENVMFNNVASAGPDVGFYFGLNCGWAHVYGGAIDNDGTTSGSSTTMIGVWFDSNAYASRFSGYTTGIGRAIINTSTGSAAHGNEVFGTEVCCGSTIVEHSGAAPLVLTGNLAAGSANFFVADGAGRLTLGDNDFTNSITPYAQSFNAIQNIQGAGTQFGPGAGTLYPQTPQVIGSAIINGDMLIDQAHETTSFAGCNNTGSGVLLVDRWRCTTNVANIGTWLKIQSTLAGSPFALQYSVGATPNSNVATNIHKFEQGIEGTSMQSWNWNTNAALPVVLDFCAYSNVQGQYTAYLRNPAATFFFPFTYNVTFTSQWQCFSQVIPGTLAGAGIGASANVIYLIVGFDLGNGSNFGTATSGAWQTGSGNIKITTPSTVSLDQNANAVMGWTGINLRQGTQTSAPHIPRDYPTELALAQRFYQKSFPPGTAVAQNAGLAGAQCIMNQVANGRPGIYIPFDPQMFSNPTVTTFNPAAADANWRNVTTPANVPTVSVDPSTAKSAKGVQIVTTAAVANIADNLCIHYTADTGN